MLATEKKLFIVIMLYLITNSLHNIFYYLDLFLVIGYMRMSTWRYVHFKSRGSDLKRGIILKAS